MTDLARTALCTEAEARAYLGLDEGDTEPNPDALKLIINGLSARIHKRTGQTYFNTTHATQDNASARVFDVASDATEIRIANVRDITKVERTTTPRDEDTWEEVDAADYLAEPYGEPVTNLLRLSEPADPPTTGQGWGILGYRNEAGDASQWPRASRATAKQLATRTYIRVTGKWGYGKDASTVPDNVKLALLMWMENINSRDQAYFSEEVAEKVITQKIPADVEELLEAEDPEGGPGAVAV